MCASPVLFSDFSCTRGLYLMFLNRVCTRSHTWVVTRGGPNEAPGNATERHWSPGCHPGLPVPDSGYNPQLLAVQP